MIADLLQLANFGHNMELLSSLQQVQRLQQTNSLLHANHHHHQRSSSSSSSSSSSQQQQQQRQQQRTRNHQSPHCNQIDNTQHQHDLTSVDQETNHDISNHHTRHLSNTGSNSNNSNMANRHSNQTILKQHPSECSPLDLSVKRIRTLNSNNRLTKSRQTIALNLATSSLSSPSSIGFLKGVEEEVGEREEDFQDSPSSSGTTSPISSIRSSCPSTDNPSTFIINHNNQVSFSPSVTDASHHQPNSSINNNNNNLSSTDVIISSSTINCSSSRSNTSSNNSNNSSGSISNSSSSNKRKSQKQQRQPKSGKAHLCNQCGRSFSRSDMLTRHSRLHSGLKPYQCGKCLQVFSRSDHLSTHERTHTGEKPYQCEFCAYSACRRDMITRHMRTHAGHHQQPTSIRDKSHSN